MAHVVERISNRILMTSCHGKACLLTKLDSAVIANTCCAISREAEVETKLRPIFHHHQIVRFQFCG